MSCTLYRSREFLLVAEASARVFSSSDLIKVILEVVEEGSVLVINLLHLLGAEKAFFFGKHGKRGERMKNSTLRMRNEALIFENRIELLIEPLFVELCLLFGFWLGV